MLSAFSVSLPAVPSPQGQIHVHHPTPFLQSGSTTRINNATMPASTVAWQRSRCWLAANVPITSPLFLVTTTPPSCSIVMRTEIYMTAPQLPYRISHLPPTDRHSSSTPRAPSAQHLMDCPCAGSGCVASVGNDSTPVSCSPHGVGLVLILCSSQRATVVVCCTVDHHDRDERTQEKAGSTQQGTPQPSFAVYATC